MPTTGLNPWDVSPEMVPKLEPFGLTVPMWFCPVRPDEFKEANDWFRQQKQGQGIRSIADLNKYLVHRFGNFALLLHDWWVPRTLDKDAKRIFPMPGLSGTVTRTKDGWPRRLEDPVASFQPIISDLVPAWASARELAERRPLDWKKHSIGESRLRGWARRNASARAPSMAALR
jgi:hypothetical protein